MISWLSYLIQINGIQHPGDFELHIEAQIQSGRLVLVKYPLKRAIPQWSGGSLTDVRLGLLSLVSYSDEFW